MQTEVPAPEHDPYAMPGAAVADPAPGPPQAPPAVWSPRAVAIITFFFSFPASFTLMVLNWRRLGQQRQVFRHLAFILPTSIALIVASLYLPDKPGRGIFFGFNLCLLAYFRNRAASDIEEFRSRFPDIALSRRHWAKGVLWSLVGLSVFFALSIVVSMVAAVVFDYEPPE